jgi:glucose uptake protein GlcU
MKDKKRLIPQNCPDCEYKFTFKDKSNHQMQKKAKVTYASTAIILPLWFIAIYFALNFLEVIAKVNVFTIIIGLAPGLVLGSFAYGMPRVLKLKCKKCTFANDIILRTPKPTDPFNITDEKP